jgi:non-ribosomal peptide synthetase component F
MTASEPWSYHPDGSPVLSLADIIRKRAAITPGLVALAEPGRLTCFADLGRRSSQVAQALQREGVVRGDRVAFIGASGPEFAEVQRTWSVAPRVVLLLEGRSIPTRWRVPVRLA